MVDHINSRRFANSKPSDNQVTFVQADDPVSKSISKRKVSSLLDVASDWKIGVDYDQTPFCFPAEICGTSQRPDLVVWSPLANTVILIELTCPAEEGIQNATNRKQERYIDLQLLICQNKWIPHLFTIEVGARGFVAKSTIKMFRALGFSHSDTSKIAKDLMEIAARCSYAIYVARECAHWDPKRPLLQIASADKRGDSAVKVTSLSPEQIERIQAQKAKALAIRKSRTVSTLPDAGSPHTSAADKKVKDRSVSWADTSGGKLTEVHSYVPETIDHSESSNKNGSSHTVNARTLTWDEAQSISDYDLDEAQNSEWIESPPSPGW